jgi:hypothetical protein
VDKHIERRRQTPAGVDPLGLSRQLECEERVASGKFVDTTKQRPREDDPEPSMEEGIKRDEVERSDRHTQDAVGSKRLLQPRFGVEPARDQQRDRLLVQAPGGIFQGRRGRAVKPLGVVDRHEERRRR